MKVIVTGANGFLGAWLTRRLLSEGHAVKALVRKNSDLSELDSVKPDYVYGDINDVESLMTAFKDQEVVFHLAGVVAYKKSERALMEKVNVEGTRNVISVCEKLKIPKLIHVSSVVALGASFNPTSMNEESPYEIHHLNLGYFETKKKAEDLVRTAARQNKIQAVCVNPSTIYGFGDAKKSSRKTQVKVARGDFKFYTSGGVNVVAVEDVVEGILLALKKGINAERYILASENMTIQNLFERIASFSKVKAPSILMPSWALHGLGFLGDTLSSVGVDIGLSQENAYTATLFHWFDSTKAQSELGFKPGDANKAIENSVRWMKDNGYLR